MVNYTSKSYIHFLRISNKHVCNPLRYISIPHLKSLESNNLESTQAWAEGNQLLQTNNDSYSSDNRLDTEVGTYKLPKKLPTKLLKLPPSYARDLRRMWIAKTQVDGSRGYLLYQPLQNRVCKVQ